MASINPLQLPHPDQTISSASASASLPTTTATTPTLSEPDDPKISFTTRGELFDQIDRTEEDVLVVTGISPQDLLAIEAERTARRRRFRLRRYYLRSKILIISIPTRVHEVLHLQLYHQYIANLARMGLDTSWDPAGATTFRNGDRPGGDGGEGDSAGGPVPTSGNTVSWPTLVIEAGYSQSLARLREDMRWWFEASDHAVKIVILAKFDRNRRHILLEKYQESVQPPKQGATTTRSVSRPLAVLQQSIAITQDTGTSPVSYNVARGALILSFRLLFLRDPRPGTGEGDIVLSIPDLQRYAAAVWRHVEED